MRYLYTQDLKCIVQQVQYAKKYKSTSQKHRCELKNIINTLTRQRVIDFITASKRKRRILYCQVNIELRLFVSNTIIRKTLIKENYY